MRGAARWRRCLTVLPAQEENKVDDLTDLDALTRLERLHLNQNAVTSLVPFAALRSLCELHLGGNGVEKLEQVRELRALPKLRVLDLSENPVTESDNYRQEVLILLPRLVKLDGEKVTREELEEARDVEKERLAEAAKAAEAGEGGGDGGEEEEEEDD